jgi:DNA-binding GntR family transcriptional regulator
VTAVLAIDLAEAQPIARQVTRALRQAIVTMRLRPGEMLSEQEIATTLGVSRQPVREAFIKLGEAGLLRVLPQRGTLVVKISRAAVEDARFIRDAVECAVAREAAKRATAAANARSPTASPGSAGPPGRRTWKPSSPWTRSSTASSPRRRAARSPGASSRT